MDQKELLRNRIRCTFCGRSYSFNNMVKGHKSLGGATPAMALGVTSEPWGLDRLISD